MNKCPEVMVFATHKEYAAPCVLPAGHVGSCRDGAWRSWQSPHSRIESCAVSYPVDANGSPV